MSPSPEPAPKGVKPLTAEQLLDLLNKDEPKSPSFDRVKEIMGKNYIGPEDYKEIFGVTDLGVAPSIPEWITPEILESECTITQDGRLVKETHRLVFIPATLDGEAHTIMTLKERAAKKCEELKRGMAFYDTDWYKDEPFANTKLLEGKWVLMPEAVLPGTLKLNFNQQEKIVKATTNYETIDALSLATVLMMNLLKNNRYLFRPGTWGWCNDEPSPKVGSGQRVFLGYFHAGGLLVNLHDVGHRLAHLGRAVLRNS